MSLLKSEKEEDLGYSEKRALGLSSEILMQACRNVSNQVNKGNSELKMSH